MANHSHLALLRQGTNIWNEWKMKHPYHLSDFSDADLSGMNLEGAYFNEANFAGANLSQARLSSAYLGHAVLTGANLWQADLQRAFLYKALLTRANLREADLKEANLSHAHLHQAILCQASLDHSVLQAANLSDADLSDACIIQADLQEAILINACLKGTWIQGAVFKRTIFSWGHSRKHTVKRSILLESSFHHRRRNSSTTQNPVLVGHRGARSSLPVLVQTVRHPVNVHLFVEADGLDGSWETGSHGCVGVPIPDAKRLYDRTPLGTSVIIRE